jgi:hypothetical protein
VDLGLGVAVSRVVIYNRNDEGSERLSNSVISLINYQGKTLKTYRIGDATDVPVFDINFASYLGCYANSPNRILPHFASGNLDPNGAIECATLCKAAGFNLAGTQISKECWCGDSLNGAQPVPNNNECNMQCLGNAAEMCGGGWQNSVYNVSSFSICDIMVCDDNKFETLDVCFPEAYGSFSAGCNFIGKCHTRLQFMFVSHVYYSHVDVP